MSICLKSSYSSCALCPRVCGVDRSSGATGFCGMSSELRISRVGLHMWEEPCLSGTRGSGTIFFTGCNLGCVFCQNYEISHCVRRRSAAAGAGVSTCTAPGSEVGAAVGAGVSTCTAAGSEVGAAVGAEASTAVGAAAGAGQGVQVSGPTTCHLKPGKSFSIEEFAQAMLSLQAQGAHNINFVTGTHYIPHIVEGVRLAREQGLILPTLYNCGGYESVEALRMLEGTIDIYLPDMKFFSPDVSKKYCGVRDYFDRCRDAIAEMVRQCPVQEFESDCAESVDSNAGNCASNATDSNAENYANNAAGAPDADDAPGAADADDASGAANRLMRRGVIVRHLMLPGLLFDTKHILDYLTETYGNQITISLMNQYTPMPGVPEELATPLNPKHYESMVNYLSILGQENAYTQEGDTVSESFIPDFE